MNARYEIRVTRLGLQRRVGTPFARTYSRYQTFYDGAATGLDGFMIERQGPGDNGAVGVADHRRLAAGSYPLSTHKSPNTPDYPHGKYRTYGYADTTDPTAIPRPCIGVDGTGHRTGILIHSAGDFLHSIGCLNPTGPLADGELDIQWSDSKARVIALIADMRARLGGVFPTGNDAAIPRAFLVITGEP